jgi:hypothetical protein
MFNVEQAPKQPIPTGFAVVQANYINLASASDKQLIVYVNISFDDGSTKEDSVTFSGLEYNSANTAFATWGGIMEVLQQKLGIKLTVPENIEEIFQNVPPPKIEEPVTPNINDNPMPVVNDSIGPVDAVPLPEKPISE